MKTNQLFKCILLIAVVAISSFAFAQKPVKVKGHYRKNGTYVAPTVRSKPNKTQTDNYSSKGNYHPYTGKKGKKNPKR